MPDTDTGWRSGFVGRGAELDALSRAVATAREGTGGFLLLAGDGGFGKTRLLEEFARRSGLPRERILWGRCPEQSGAPALWPWSRALGSFIATLGDEELRSHLGAAAAHVARVVPDLCDRLGLPTPQAAASDDNRFRVFGGIAGFLARAADVAPMLVLFDDLHFADRASLALLDFVVHELRQARVVVVGAYRARELRQEPDTTAWMARASEHIALAGFARAEVEDFIRVRAGVSPTAAVVAQLHEATEGHPYFLDELVRLLEPDGQLTSATPPEVGSRLSEGVRAAIRRRLAPLPAHDRRTLELAAVLGRSFDLGTLQLARGAPPEEILDELSSAIASGIVEDVPRAPTEFRFTHALIREAIYGDLLPAARAQAHRRVALALEQRSGDAGEGPLAELAHHFYFSAALGDADKAVDYATRAAARALALGAHEESIAHYERALQALGLLPANDARRVELLLALGLTLWRAGREAAARETFRRAAASARALGDPAALARAAMGFNSTSALTGVVDDAAVKLLEEGLAALGEHDSSLRSLLLSYLSMRLYFAPDRARATALAQQATATSERLQDAGSLSIALLAEHYASWQPDGLAARRDIAQRIVTTAGRAGATMALLEGRMWCVVDALEAGDVAAADVELDALYRQARDEGLARWLAQAEFMRGTRALLAARFDAATRHAERALAVRPAEDQNNAAQFQLVQAFVVHRERGSLREIEPAVATVVQRHPALPIWRAGYALLLADTGRASAAARIVDQLLADDGRSIRRDSNWMPTLALLTEVAALTGRARHATLLASALEPYADRLVVLGTGVACYGSVARYLGLAAQSAGRLDEAVLHLEAALGANGRLGAPALVARTQCDLAAVLRARGAAHDGQRAGELLAAAGTAIASHDLTGLAAQLERLQHTSAVPGRDPLPGEPPSSSLEHGQATLRREGEYWTVAYGSATFRLKDSKGLNHLQTLLRHPGREFHVLDLAATGDLPGSTAAVDLGDAGELLDADARAAYRRRLEELRDEAEEARGFNDLERATRAEHELELLAEELARGMGLGGRSRRAASAAERARQNLSRSIGTVIKKITAGSPALGYYLSATIHTGAFCSYDPDPRAPVAWTFDEQGADS